jgi:hypothetical protein
MRSLALALAVVAGCLPGESNDHLLNEDAHFVGIVPPFDGPFACLHGADDPRSCSFALTFCLNGRAARRAGEVIDEGTYYADEEDRLVHAFIGEHEVFFDVKAVVEVAGTMEWQIDVDDLWQNFLFETIDCNVPRGSR